MNCCVLLPNHDRPNQAFPDLMHNLKNIVCSFFYLITGKGDTLKVAEKELCRFPGCWPREKEVDQPEAEKAVESRFLQSFITPKLSGTLMACIIHDHYQGSLLSRTYQEPKGFKYYGMMEFCIINLKMYLTTQCEQTKYWLNSSYMLISTNSV